MSALRVQHRRIRGWSKPDGAVYVVRGTRWGNPFRVGAPGVPDNAIAVALFRAHVAARHDYAEAVRRELRGKTLVCWCKLDEPCHADVLLEIANAEATL